MKQDWYIYVRFDEYIINIFDGRNSQNNILWNTHLKKVEKKKKSPWKKTVNIYVRFDEYK